MSVSPVHFARDFAKLKSDLASRPAGDERLLLLVRFWPVLAGKSDNSSYRSYFDEYFAILLPLVSPANLTDLSQSDLEQILKAFAEMRETCGADIAAVQEPVVQRLAALDFYVGDISAGLKSCAEFLNEDPVELPDDVIGEKGEYESFCALQEFLKAKYPRLYQFIQPINREWASFRDAYYHDRIACLFVDRNHRGPTGRGRLRILEGSVERSGKTATSDEVSFDNQVKAPDDPFVGVTYDALTAVRKHFHTLDDRTRSKTFYHAHYAIRESAQSFTGDSIGLATALVTYTNLLHPEILRLERFVSSEEVLTGGLPAGF